MSRSLVKPESVFEHARRLKIMKSLRLEGMSYREIGKLFQRTGQRVQQIIKEGPKGPLVRKEPTGEGATPF